MPAGYGGMVLSVTSYGDMVCIGHLNQHFLQCNIDKFHLWDIFLQNNETVHALKIAKKPLNNTYNSTKRSYDKI